jgi:hypothetical protein
MRQSVGLIAVRKIVLLDTRVHAADGEAVEKSIARRTALRLLCSTASERGTMTTLCGRSPIFVPVLSPSAVCCNGGPPLV